MNYIGIDGCRTGWVAWILENGAPKLLICSTLNELVQFAGGEGYWLIDMPIGLSTPEQPDRLCDKGARAILKKRRSSVFTVPCREAVYSDTYELACEKNLELLGKKFSKQTWGIVPKIREVDGFVQNTTSVVVRESHPEVVFAGLAGRPMSFNKKTVQGREERLSLLSNYVPEWLDCLLKEMERVPRKIAELDDLIDAFVLLVIATKWNELVSVPLNVSSKEGGLAREIVYYPTKPPELGTIHFKNAIPSKSRSRGKRNHKANWPQLLAYLKENVPTGTLTTYKQLSEEFYGHANATQAIISMLKAAVSDDFSNSQWTNRVVGVSGNVVDVNGQKEQLLNEGIKVINDKVQVML
nr:DUF429 domain-containing protein [Vibrio campbellii]